jgi:hypothetical protein
MRYRIPTVLAAAAGAVALAAAPAAAAPTWTVTPGANTVPSDARLNAVSARTGQDAWAVGIYKGPNEHDGGVMLAERWNGSVWTQTPTPNVQFFDENLLAVSAASGSDVWATGSTNQTGFKSTNPITAHFDGTTWTIVSTPATTGGSKSILDGVVNFGGGNVWAVGRGRNAHALIEHLTPNGWTIVPSPDPVLKSGSSFASSTLTGISAISPSDIWAVGTYSVVTGTVSDSFTLVEHYNGSTWSIVASPNPAPRHPLNGARQTLNAVRMVSSTDGWAVGNTFDTASGSFQPNGGLILHWNGLSWSVDSTPVIASMNVISGISGASSSDLWAVGEGLDTSGSIPIDRAQTLHRNASGWTAASTPTGTGDSLLNGVSALSGGEAWAVGSTSDSSTSQTTILHHTP